MSPSLPATLLLGAAVLLAPAPSAAIPRPPGAGEVSVVRAGSGAELRVRGRAVVRLAGPRATAKLQAAAVRLEPLLPPPTTVGTRTTRWTGILIVDDTVVLTVTRAEVARYGLPGPLVAQWARALEEALAVPPITVSRADLVLSPGRSETVAVAAAGTTAVTVGAYDQQIVDVALKEGEARLTGKALGSTIVPFRAGPYRAQMAVSVRPPAGRIPVEAEVIVTGAPATPDLIREAVERRLEGVVLRDPGATLQLGRIAVDGPLSPGRSATIAVTVGVRSPYGGPVDATVQVRVVNVHVQIADPDVLLVSNRPERITDNGLLFRETLAPGRPARLLYHHLNATLGQARVLKITLHNPGAGVARVHYLAGHAGPSGDPIFIGFASTQRFLDALLAGRGYVVEVPSGATSTFTAYALPPLALVSGLMQFQVIEGGAVELVVHVRVPWLLDKTVMTDLGPYAFPHPRGTFPGSVVDLVRELPAHQAAPVADLGVASALRDLRTGEALVGDYGVLYRLRLRLTNPTDREVGAALVANAAGGLARGLYFINGSPVDVGLMRAFEEREIAAFTLAPGATREVTVLTMPVAGSYYPVRLSLRPR
jgi:hypothetical protein